MLAFVDLESRVPVGHPIRTIKRLADAALSELSPLFDEIYAETGRPSIPPERLLKASLLIALYSVRSERAFCEELEYHLLFRWFLDMSLVEPGFDASTFSKNRERLLRHEVGQQFFDEVVFQAQARKLLSDEHFTVDGTLIEACAGLKSFKRRDRPPSDEPPDDPGNPTVDFHKEKRSNKTHRSTTDPESRLLKKGKGKGSEALLHGPRPDGEPARPASRLPDDRGDRDGRAGRDAEAAAAGPGSGLPPEDPRRRQELRHPRLRGRHPRVRRHPARRPEHQRSPERHRRSHDSPPGLCRQPADPKARRGDLRLDEDRRRLPPDPLPWA
jgi:transposase